MSDQSRLEPLIRVKLIGGWASSADICAEWARMSQGDLRWNRIQVTSDDDADFYAIINFPFEDDEFYRPDRTIVFQMEPWCADPAQTWGVKTWGYWAEPDPALFLQVRTPRTGVNNAFWQLASTYDELRQMPIKKTGVLSAIISEKYFDPGHIQRVDFLHYIEDRDDDIVRVHMYAYDNAHNFSSWVGPHPPGYKDAALLPYRYFLGTENNYEPNFITEKLWEPLLTETLCFYTGAPNAAEHIDPRAFIPIDLNDFERAFQRIRHAIVDDEWSRRLEYIRREKRKVLEHFQFFPTLERVLLHDMAFTGPVTDDEVLFHKYFAHTIGDSIGHVAFIHSYTVDGDTRILQMILDSLIDAGLPAALDRVYVVNVGDPIDLDDLLEGTAGRVRVINRTPDGAAGERLTLDLLRAFAQHHREAKVLYLHTKGASHGERFPQIDDWRNLMLHVVVERFGDCLAALQSHDAVGANLLAAPHAHFSGNFWWSTASHIASLPPLGPDRHDAEWWVLSKPGTRAISLHDSGIDHYVETYPAHRYR